MKQFFTIASLAIITSVSYGQVTITSQNVARPGQIVRSYDQDYTKGTYPLMTGGAGKTWDFSSFSKDDSSVFNVIPNGWKPTIAAKNPNTDYLFEDKLDSTIILIDVSSTDLRLVGRQSDSYEDRDQPYLDVTFNVVTFPMTMGTKSTKSGVALKFASAYGIDPDGIGPLPVIDSVEVTLTTTDSFTGIGYGSVKLPSVTVPNCIMVQTKSRNSYAYRGYYNNRWNAVSSMIAKAIGFDTADAPEYTQRWWTTEANYGFPVAEISYEEGEDSFSAPTFMDGPATVNGVNNLTHSQIQVYPVPAKSVLSLNTGIASYTQYKIMDMTGRTLVEHKLDSGKIDVSQLPKGNYIIRLEGPNNYGSAQFVKE